MVPKKIREGGGDHHPVKISICYRTSYLSVGGGGETIFPVKTGKKKKASQCHDFSGLCLEQWVENARLQISGYRSHVFLEFQIARRWSKHVSSVLIHRRLSKRVPLGHGASSRETPGIFF